MAAPPLLFQFLPGRFDKFFETRRLRREGHSRKQRVSLYERQGNPEQE